MTICFVISIFASLKDKSIKPVFYLLLLSLITEIFVEVVLFKKQNFYYIYHIYTPLEYLFISYYFLSVNHNKRIAYAIKISALVFTLFCIYSAIRIVPFNEYPGLTYNAEGVLVIIFSIITLFNLHPQQNIKIQQLPVFWFCLAFLVFYSGIFFINFLYNTLLKQNNEVVKMLYKAITLLFNYILYFMILIGLICSRKMKKL